MRLHCRRLAFKENFVAYERIDLRRFLEFLGCVDQEVHADVVIANLHDVFDPLEESLVGFLNEQQIEIACLGNTPRRERTEHDYLLRLVVVIRQY